MIGHPGAPPQNSDGVPLATPRSFGTAEHSRHLLSPPSRRVTSKPASGSAETCDAAAPLASTMGSAAREACSDRVTVVSPAARVVGVPRDDRVRGAGARRQFSPLRFVTWLVSWSV